MGMANLLRYVTFLSPDQLKKLQAISTRTGAPVSTLIRMAVTEYLKKEK
jgi:ribbon-helix-helix protein